MRVIFPLLFFVLTLSGVPGWGAPLQVVALEELRPFEALVSGVLISAGFQPRFFYEPEARMVVDLKSGQAQAALFMADAMIAGIPGLVKVPVPLFRNEVVAVTVDPGISISGIGDLEHYSVGIERGNLNHLSIVKGLSEVAEASDQDQQFRMLKGGRFQVAISARALVSYLAKRAGIEKYFIQEPPLKVSPLYFTLMNPDEVGGLESLTVAFRKVVDDGSWFREVNQIVASMEP